MVQSLSKVRRILIPAGTSRCCEYITWTMDYGSQHGRLLFIVARNAP